MSYHLIIDDEPVGDFASTMGAADFRRWAEEQGGELAHLSEHGWSQSPGALVEQLGDRLTHSPPESESVIHTARNLLERAKAAKDSVIISDGT